MFSRKKRKERRVRIAARLDSLMIAESLDVAILVAVDRGGVRYLVSRSESEEESARLLHGAVHQLLGLPDA